MKVPERILQDDRWWHPVPAAARRLRTNPNKIRALMGDGTLEWCQKGNTRTLMVSVESVEAYRTSKANPKAVKPGNSSARSPDPLARRAGDLPKMGDRDPSQQIGSGWGVFAPTWDPRSGREKKPSGS